MVAVGGLEPEYQPLLLIESVDELRNEFPNAGLIIVGGGSLRSVAEQAIAARSLQNNIFLAGPAEHGVVLKLIEKADLMLRVTQFDGDAISVRESLFLGTPVIASRTGLRPEGVQLIDDQTPKSIVTAIEKVLSDPIKPGVASDDSDNVSEVVDLYLRLAGK